MGVPGAEEVGDSMAEVVSFSSLSVMAPKMGCWALGSDILIRSTGVSLCMVSEVGVVEE